MIQDIIDFFSSSFLEIFVRFFSNIASFFYNNILSKVYNLLPDLSLGYYLIDSAFDFVTPYFIFLKDAFMISDLVFYLLVSTVIFKICGTYVVFLVKLFLKWYRQLMP